jgi:hypothetical protein
MGIFLHVLDIGWDTSTPAGTFMRQVMAATDQFSSGMTSQRNKASAAVLISQGRCAGGPRAHKPHGYHRHGDNTLTPDVEERQVMELIVRLSYHHDVDWDRIATRLQSDVAGGRIKKTREWNEDTVRNSIKAWFTICRREGTEGIKDVWVKQYTKKRLAKESKEQ